MALMWESHLQETLTDNEHLKPKCSWVVQVYFSSFATTSRGVVILKHRKLLFQLVLCVKERYPRLVIIKGVLHGEEMAVMNFCCCCWVSL